MEKMRSRVLSDGWVVNLPIGDLGWKIRWIRFFPLESRLYLHTFAIAAPLFRPGQCSSAGCSCDGHCMCFVGLAHFFTVPCSSVCEFLFTSINIAHVPSNSTKRTKQSNSSSSSASTSTVVAASAAAAVGAIAGTYFYKQRNNDNKMEGIKTQVEGLTKQVKGALHLGRPAGSTKGSPPKEGERKYLIGGNWKCNGNVASLTELIDTFNKAGPIPANAKVAICAPFIHIPLCLSKLREDIAVGAQNCGVNEKEGAYTGEICASQLKDIGCVWVVIGHSERREGFGMAGEDSELVAKKVKVALDAGLKVMFAIGEKKEERENGTTNDVCASQLAPAAKLLEEKDWENVAIAYEPVWAIGTGLTATPEMAQETHAFIRKWMSENVSEAVAKAIRIQYGGSMKGANAKDLLAQPDIDGGLIGGASLKADFFNVINGVSQDE